MSIIIIVALSILDIAGPVDKVEPLIGHSGSEMKHFCLMYKVTFYRKSGSTKMLCIVTFLSRC